MDLNNTGAMRSPFSPRVRQSITGRRPVSLSSAKKNQSKYMQSTGEQTGDVIYKTPLITVQTHGLPLPVMVTEALTFGSSEVSVRMSSCGWCWIVTGRRILAWPRCQSSDESGVVPAGGLAARELILPQTDLAHKADLVMLFYADSAQMPSCVGVSPEGVVRLWGSVAQEGAHADVTCALAGQECERLVAAARGALLLATTTCTLVLLTPLTLEGRLTVTCRTLRPPSGWLGGLGRRVSLMFFGSMPAHAETRLVGVVCVGGEGAEPHIALVGGGPVLQLWRGGGGEVGSGGGASGGGVGGAGGTVHEHSLRRALAESPHLVPHGEAGGAGGGVELAALDVRASAAGELLLLVAARTPAPSPVSTPTNSPTARDTRYAIAHISIGDPAAPVVRAVVPLRGLGGAAETEELPRFLPLDSHVLLYTSNYIAIASAVVSNDKMEVISVASEGDQILGAAPCGAGEALVFSRKHGVLLLSLARTLPPRSVCESPVGSPPPRPSEMYDGNLSLFEIDPHEISAMTTDASGKLKTAFLFHLRRHTAECRELLHQLFPLPPGHRPGGEGEEGDGDVDNVLDRTVMKIAKEMLDDIPAGDPRWKGRHQGGPATNIALGSSAALQIHAQLQDKRRALTLFLEFLRAAGLWPRLGRITAGGGGCVGTERALAGLAERLAAAVALRRLQQGEEGRLIDAAVFQVVCGEGHDADSDTEGEGDDDPEVEEAISSGALSPSDACYRRVTRVRRVLRALARAPVSAHAGAHTDAHAHARTALATINILNGVLAEVRAVRGQWRGAAPPAPPRVGPRALLPALLDLLKWAVKQCARQCREGEGAGGLRAQVVEAAAALADGVLHDAQPLQLCARTARFYEAMRRDAIRPFLEEGYTERAAVLAEKYKDFELLVEMCVDGDDVDRLHGYIEKYIDEGMAETAFAWLCDRGGRHAALLVRRVGAGAGAVRARLRAWLGAAGGRAELALLARLGEGDAGGAAALLARMAEEDAQPVARLTTVAALGKLCLLAAEAEAEAGAGAEESAAWRRLEARLALAEQQAALPRDLRLHHGVTDDSHLLRPEELIQMYAESESRALTEYDYKKALDLTGYIQDEELRDDLRLRIWCASILRDEWTSSRMDAPEQQLRASTYSRLADLVLLMDGEEALPALGALLRARPLAALLASPAARYLLQCAHGAAAPPAAAPAP